MANELTLPTPSIKNISAFDVTKGGTLTFNLGAGGTQFVRSSVVQFFDSDGVDIGIPIAESVYNSTSNEHVISPNLIGLQNNKQYVVTVTVFTGLDRTGDFSAQSKPMLVWCLPEPKITFKPTPKTIETSSYTFEVIFNGLNLLVPDLHNNISSYQFFLYDDTGLEQQRSEIRYGRGGKQSDGTYILQQTFSNLKNAKEYSVFFQCETEQNMELSTFSNTISVKVDEPKSGKPIIRNNPCNGTIEVKADKKSIASSLSNSDINLMCYYSDRQGRNRRVSSVLWNDEYTFSALKLEINKGTTVNTLLKPMGNIGTQSQYYAPYIDDLSKVKVTQQGEGFIKEFFPNQYGMVQNMISTYPTMQLNTNNDSALLKVSFYDNTYTGERKQVEGSRISINDVSPIKHLLNVKCESANLIDLSKLTLNPNIIYNSIDNTLTVKGQSVATNRKFKELCPDVKENDELFLNMVNIGGASGILFDDVNGLHLHWASGDKRTITKELLESTITLYGHSLAVNATISDFVISRTREISNTPYITDFSSATLKTRGKNILPPLSKIYHRWYIVGQNDENVHKTFLEKGKTYTFTVEKPLPIKSSLRCRSRQNELQHLVDLNINDTTGTFTCDVETGYYLLFLYDENHASWDGVDIGSFQLAEGYDSTYEPYETHNYSINANGVVNNVYSIGTGMTLSVDTEGVLISVTYYSTTDTTLKPEKLTVINNSMLLYDMSPIPHMVECTVLNKNIISYPYVEQSLTRNGITYNVQSDGTIHAKGTATDSSYFILNNSTNMPMLLNNKTYYFSLEQETDLSQITKLKLQKRRSDRIDDKWTTIDIIDTSIQSEEIDPFNIKFQDITNIQGVGYNYKFVPIIEQTQSDGGVVQIEGDGDISDTVYSSFKDVFICDLSHSYKLKYEVGYDSMEQNQQMGVHNTIGNKYPIVVSNSNLNYKTSGVHCLVLNDDYGQLDKTKNVYNGIDVTKSLQQRERLLDFLTNKQPKILKDENGNIWLVMITGNPQIEFINEYYMGIANIGFTWVEIGNPVLESDLEYCGLIGGTEKSLYAGISPQLIADITAKVQEFINVNTLQYNRTYKGMVHKINSSQKTVDVIIDGVTYMNVPVYGVINSQKDNNIIEYIKVGNIVEVVKYYDNITQKDYVYAEVKPQVFLVNQETIDVFNTLLDYS